MNIAKKISLLVFLVCIFGPALPTFAKVTCPGATNSTLTWTTANPGSCVSFTHSPSDGSACDFPVGTGNGSMSIPLGTSCTADLTCWSGAGGTGSILSQSSDSLTYDSTKIWNGSACVAPSGSAPVVSASWSPASIANGGMSTISYSSTGNPSSCTAVLTGWSPWSGALPTPSFSNNLGPFGGDETATITCTNASGSGSITTTLTVGAPVVGPDCPVGYYNTNGNGVAVAGRYICFQSGCQYGNQFSSNGFNANGDPIALYTCASGAAANCGQFANVTRLNPPWFDEVTIFDLCSNNSGRDTQNPPSTAQAWNWTCINFNTSNTICTAPRYGCRTVTDSNYTLPQYGASGPANNYGCALTCANGANDYSTCLNVPFGPTGYITGPSTCSILVGASTCSATVSWLTNNPVTTSAITTNVPTNNTILYTANSGGPSAVSVTGGVAQTFYLYNNSTLLDSLTITPTCALGSWDTLYGRCADPRILNPLVINDYYPPGTFTFSCSGSTHYTVVRAGVVYVATTTYTTPVSISGVNTAGNYVLRCLSGNVASDAVVYYNTTPSSPTVSVKITPKTITPGEKVTVSWDTAYPTNACTLTARVVCANNACSAAQLAETSSLNAILNTTTTDNNDPNTSRNLQTAVKTVAPGHMGTDWKALGKKTLSIRYTTDFTYDCGGANKETKRVQVTHSEEQ